METQIDTSPEQRAVRYHEEMLAGLQRTVEAAWHCGEALEAVKRSRRHGSGCRGWHPSGSPSAPHSDACGCAVSFHKSDNLTDLPVSALP